MWAARIRAGRPHLTKVLFMFCIRLGLRVGLLTLGATFALSPLSSTAQTRSSSKALVDLDDPRHDDKGPGTYIYPSDANYRPGQFDLRRLRVRHQGSVVIFEVELDSAIRKPNIARFSDAFELTLENGVYVQNVDICIDTTKGQGETRAIPGRRVRFKREEAWDVCIVATPLPHRARSVIDGWNAKGRVLIPANVRAQDRRVIIRIPDVELGGPPDASWGYQVLITGTQWQNSFDAVNRLLGNHVVNVYTMPVATVAEQLAFGGGELSNYHPWVVDLLMPPTQSQRRALKGFSDDHRQFATVPMVYPDPAAHKKALDAAVPVDAVVEAQADMGAVGDYVYGTIKDFSGDLVVLDIDPSSVAAFRLGDVLDEEGQVVARVVTSQLYKSFVVATPVDGRERIRSGLKVRFRGTSEK